MRKKIASLAAIAVMTGGLGLTTAGTSQAAVPTRASVTSATSVASVTAAYYNFGLSIDQGKSMQCWLNYYGWGPLTVDGQLGTASWKSFQRFLATYYDYTGAIDGVPGTNTIKALQRVLARFYDYMGPIDGVAGPATESAFRRMANARDVLC
ncbi:MULTISPECIES: peptidoglycan-binding domain-containing protein [unclassified Streptomyces]|uniref:peptidoglycan-binding domain-containing protein n=1 Tax=unclassified Streptomyces TaxID=2593676 RepID=UPI0035E26F05